MARIVEDAGGIVRVRALPNDSIARVRQLRRAIESRTASGQQAILTNAERDLLLLAIAQKLGILT